MRKQDCFLDPDSQKYADPRIRIQGVKYQPKTTKKTFLLLKPKSELMKKEIIKISSFLNGSSSFRIKISEKNKTIKLKIICCYLERKDPDPFFSMRIQDPDPHQI